MDNHPVVLGNQDGKTASGAAPTFSILAKQPQCSGRADQRNLLSNHDSCDLMSSAISSVKSKVKTCLPANCTSGGITVTLDNNTMWNDFYHCNTEMILTKQGRRMFPYCRYWITGLEPNLKYILVMDISPVDNFRYKWNGYSWEPSGKAEPHVLGRVFIHPESPSTGRYWMLQPVSFYKLKLTNNTLDQEGHIILHSMHRYLPRLHLVPADKATEVIQLNGPDVQTFTFPQTEFFAVTAYQNIQITQLKIGYNPFAKGLMKDGLKSRFQYEVKQNAMSLHEAFPNCDRCSYSPGAVILNSGQRDLNASHRSQKMCNTGLERESFISDTNEHDEQALKQESSEFLIANACESNSHVKPLLISNEGINISIEEELVDDCDSAPNVNTERIWMKQEDTHKETKDFSCNDDDPILEKQLKKHSNMRRKVVVINSHKRSNNSPLGVAKTKMLKLDNGTMPVKDCEVTKSMVMVPNLQASFSSCGMDKSSLRHSTCSFPVHFENIIRPLDVVETKIKKLFSGNEKAQKCSLVKDVPWENIQLCSSHSMKKKTSYFKLVPSAAAKFIVEGKKPNIAKKPVLSHDADSNPSAVLSGPCRRGRPQKLKFPEIKQPLKYTTSVIRNSCAALGPHSDHPEFMLDLEDVDGVLFVSFESKEGLHSHTIDKSGRTEDLQNVQNPLQITYDSGCQEKLSLLETKLLEDLKSFRHKQVIHPSLREVGMKLGSVDPTISIDLKYLGVQLPLSSSKDHLFGNNQGTSPSSLDSGLSFISKTGKTDNFRKIKGWQEKFHSAAEQKGSIPEGSLKNRAAFCSDKLDEYLESEGKQMETSMEISTSFSSHPLVYQLSSERSNYVQAHDSILKKTSTITPPTSYSLNSPLPSIFRKSRRNVYSKQAASRGSIGFNNSAVPLPVLSKEKHNFQTLEDKCIHSQPNSKTDNTVDVLMIPDLDENMQGKQRSICQSKQNSHLSKSQRKLMDLEGYALQDGKAQTYITEERADFSLTTLFISQVDVKLIDLEDCASQQGKPQTYVSEERADVSLSALFTAQALLNHRHVCKLIRRQTTLCSSNFCQHGCVCTSLALEKSQPTISGNTKCTLECLKGKMALIKGTPIKKPLHGILACCNGQEEEWKLEPMNKWERRNDDVYKAELEQSSINFPICVKGEETDKKPIYISTPSATKSTKCMMLPHSEVVLPFNKLNPIYKGVKLEQVKTSNSISVDSDCELPEELCDTENDSGGNSVNANQKEELGNIKLEEGKILHVQEAVFIESKVTISDLIPEENELLLNQPDSFEDRGTSMIISDKNTSASETVLKHTGKELTSEAPFIYPDISTDAVSSDHSYISRKPNMETAEVTIEKEQHAKYLGGKSDKISEGYKQTTILESNVLQENSRIQEEIVQFKRSSEKHADIAQTQRPATASETHKQTQLTSEEMVTVEWPSQQSQIISMNCTKMQQRGTRSTPCQWENKNDFSLSTKHWKEERTEHIKPERDEEEKKTPGVNFTKFQNTVPRKQCKKTVQELSSKRNNDFQGDSQSIKDNLVQINKTSSQSVAKCLERNISKINHHKKGLMPIDTIMKNTEHNGNRDDFAEEMIDRVLGYKTENILNTELFPGQKGATNSIIQHIASPMRKNAKEKVECGAVHLEQRKSHIQETETMDFKVTMSHSKPQELVTQPESHAERIKYDKNAITSRIVGKNTEMVEQLSRDASIFQLDAVLADHSYFLKETAKMEERVKLSEDKSDDISQLDKSESGEGNKNMDIEFTEKELLQKTSIMDIETAAACALPSRNLHFVRDYSDKEITPSPKQAELRNSKPKDVARTVARFRSKHTEEECCRRKEIKELFEKLQMTLRLHSLPRVAKRILLEKAFEEIQGLTDQADKLMGQKKLLMHKQGILIRKVSALSGKTKEIVLKKLQTAKQKAIEVQQQQQKQSVKAVETAETARPDMQNSLPSETKEVILSKRQEKPMLLSRTGSCTTEIEDSFLMPRIVNVMSLATEENTDLNLDVKRNPYVSLIIDSQSSESFLPVVPLETINIQSVENADGSRGNKRDTAETTEHRSKENVSPQIVNVCTLKESSDSFATKFCTEELAQSQVEEKQTNRGGGRQQSKDSSFQELQVKEPKVLGLQMGLQKVASTILAPDASDLMNMEDNDDTDETFTSLQKEPAFLNQQLNDNASYTSDLPRSLHSCFSPRDMKSHMESATRDGSPFQFDLLGRSFQNLCLVQESSGSITPLLLQLEDDSVADCDRILGQPLFKPGILKLMLGSEVMDPNTNLSAISIGGSEKYMEPLSKITHLSPPSLKMKTNQKPDKADSVWKPMPKLAPFGLKPANFPSHSGWQINKVMPLLAPSKAKVSSIGLKTTKSVTSQEQD